jgi:hypothetical protein
MQMVPFPANFCMGNPCSIGGRAAIRVVGACIHCRVVPQTVGNRAGSRWNWSGLVHEPVRFPPPKLYLKFSNLSERSVSPVYQPVFLVRENRPSHGLGNPDSLAPGFPAPARAKGFPRWNARSATGARIPESGQDHRTQHMGHDALLSPSWPLIRFPAACDYNLHYNFAKFQIKIQLVNGETKVTNYIMR